MKRKNKWLLRILVVIFLTVMVVSVWKIWEIYSEYRIGEKAYNDISHMILLPPNTEEPRPSATTAPSEGTEPSSDEDFTN